MHSEILQTRGETDEAPDAEDRGDAGHHEAGGGDPRGVHHAQEQPGQSRPRGERDDEDQAHRGKRVDGIVEDLGEQDDPHHLQAHAEAADAGRDDPERPRPTRVRPSVRRRRLARRVADPERHEAGERVRRRGDQVARSHADGRGKAEPHRRDAGGATQGVQRVQRAAARSDEAGCGERMTERGQRRAQRHRHRNDRDGDDRGPARHARAAEPRLRTLARQPAQERVGRDRAGGDPELEPRVSTNGRGRRLSGEKRSDREPGEVGRQHRGRGRRRAAEHEPGRSQP